MDVVFCWRCERDVPMFDEVEWRRLGPLLERGEAAVKRYREVHGVTLEGVPMREVYADALAEHQRIAGHADVRPQDIGHHRRAAHGPLCGWCGKPLRTPLARRCVACGLVRNARGDAVGGGFAASIVGALVPPAVAVSFAVYHVLTVDDPYGGPIMVLLPVMLPCWGVIAAFAFLVAWGYATCARDWAPQDCRGTRLALLAGIAVGLAPFAVPKGWIGLLFFAALGPVFFRSHGMRDRVGQEARR